MKKKQTLEELQSEFNELLEITMAHETEIRLLKSELSTQKRTNKFIIDVIQPEECDICNECLNS